MSQIRAYRSWAQDKDLVSFSVKIAESDLFIRADKVLSHQAEEILRRYRGMIEEYIQKNPQFRDTLEPYPVKDQAPQIIQEMVRASESAQVGPMAAVAGAVAEYVGKDLLQYSSEIIVENGGDIFISAKRTRKIGIFAGESAYSGRLALQIEPGDWGVCASSATVGPSLSFGRTDATIAVCHCAILADAWATRLGNMVKSAADLEKTLRFAQDQPQIKGVVIILGEKIAAAGDIKLV